MVTWGRVGTAGQRDPLLGNAAPNPLLMGSMSPSRASPAEPSPCSPVAQFGVRYLVDVALLHTVLGLSNVLVG